MIERRQHLDEVLGLLRRHPVVAILGARQVGKTTLAAQVMAKRARAVRFDLEDPSDLGRLADPKLALEGLRGLVVVDEIQRRPDLFPLLRVLADRPRKPARFLILGSASPDLIRRSSETLAGRVVYHELTGFSLEEVGASRLERLWLRGGFPRSFLARSLRESQEWRKAFVRTFLERDIPQLGIAISSATLRRFWTMLAHYHGQLWNASEFGRSFGVADTTVRRYLNLLHAVFVLRVLTPFRANLRKRQVRSPKVYLSDSGLLHTLLGLDHKRDLEAHPKLGASWEGFAIETLIHHLGIDSEECFFWRTQQGAELDLLVMRGNRRWGFECKRTASPRITRSMHVALEDLQLERLDVIHAGQESYPLGPHTRAIALGRLLDDLEPAAGFGRR